MCVCCCFGSGGVCKFLYDSQFLTNLPVSQGFFFDYPPFPLFTHTHTHTHARTHAHTKKVKHKSLWPHHHQFFVDALKILSKLKRLELFWKCIHKGGWGCDTPQKLRHLLRWWKTSNPTPPPSRICRTNYMTPSLPVPRFIDFRPPLLPVHYKSISWARH